MVTEITLEQTIHLVLLIYLRLVCPSTPSSPPPILKSTQVLTMLKFFTHSKPPLPHYILFILKAEPFILWGAFKDNVGLLYALNYMYFL